MDYSITVIIVTSAAAGAFVSSIITFIGQYFERNYRKREMIMKFASKLAARHTDKWIAERDKSGKDFKIYDEILAFEGYFQWLDELFKTGKIPEDPRIVKPPEVTKD